MKPHPTSLRVIFADSASNQERSPYPPPSTPSPPGICDRGGQIRARSGCHWCKNDWMFDVKELCQPRADHYRPSLFCGQFGTPYSLRADLLFRTDAQRRANNGDGPSDIWLFDI